jgi:hypothetical protein
VNGKKSGTERGKGIEIENANEMLSVTETVIATPEILEISNDQPHLTVV